MESTLISRYRTIVAVAVTVLFLSQEKRVVLFAVPFIDPKDSRVSVARLEFTVHRVEIIDLEGERAGLTPL